MLKSNFTLIIFFIFFFFLRNPCVKESTLTAQTKLITVSASEWNGWTSKILHENETLLLDSPTPNILPAFPVTELHFPSAPCMTNHHCCDYNESYHLSSRDCWTSSVLHVQNWRKAKYKKVLKFIDQKLQRWVVLRHKPHKETTQKHIFTEFI